MADMYPEARKAVAGDLHCQGCIDQELRPVMNNDKLPNSKEYDFVCAMCGNLYVAREYLD